MTIRHRRGAVLLALAVLLVAVGLWLVSNARCVTLVGVVTCRVETEKRVVALSFDDGPTQAGLDVVLPVLAAADAGATFFLIGREAQRRPDLVRRLVEAGHELGNHSWSHPRMIGRSGAFYRGEIAQTEQVFRAAGAPRSRLFRPPYGKKLIGLPLAVSAAGLRMVTWDVEDPSGVEGNPSAYAKAVLAAVRPGSIILIHPMYSVNRTARAALPLILHGLKARGYRVVPVGALMATSMAAAR